MIDWYRNRYRNVIREPLRQLAREQDTVQRAIVDDAVAWFNRKGDYETLRGAMIKRFATFIKKEKVNPDANYADGGAWYWTMQTGKIGIRDDAATAIDAGHVEVINTGIGQRIVQANSTLFTEPDQLFRFQNKGSDKPVDKVEEVMTDVRSAGSFQTKSVELDSLACMVESGWMHIYYKGGELRYDALPPSSVWLKFGSKIVYVGLDGTETDSWVDCSDIDDASAVIIRVASRKGDYDSSPDEQRYLAYVGCCEDWPEGRYVVYRAREPWPIPTDETEEQRNAIDYEHMEGSTPCNPLTWMLHHGNDKERALVTTEYPVVLWRAGYQAVSNELPPISTSLYEGCIELEIGWSRLLRYSLSSARGVDLLKMAEESIRIPHSTDVMVIGEKDDYQKTGWAASNSRDAANVLSIIQEQKSGGFNVPGYLVVGQLAGMNPQSGVALAIQTAPLISFRSKRHKLNSDAMNRIWEIERALLVQGHPKETRGLLTGDIEQYWHPGEWRIPGSELEDLQAQKEALDQGLDDQAMAVRRRHRLRTDEEAEKLIETMRQRDPGYPDNKQSTMFGSEYSSSAEEQPVVKPDGKPDGAETGVPTDGTADVQKQALNGAQITAIADMASQVARGELTPEAAIEILVVAIPGLDRDSAKRMVGVPIDKPGKWNPSDDDELDLDRENDERQNRMEIEDSNRD